MGAKNSCEKNHAKAARKISIKNTHANGRRSPSQPREFFNNGAVFLRVYAAHYEIESRAIGKVRLTI